MFNAADLEGLKPHELDIGIAIDDDDPDPNTIKKLSLNTRDAEYEAELVDGVWLVEGQEVGPDLARQLVAIAAMPGLGDLSEMQGPENFARQRDTLGPRGFLERRLTSNLTSRLDRPF